jgi:hypothetical protein
MNCHNCRSEIKSITFFQDALHWQMDYCSHYCQRVSEIIQLIEEATELPVNDDAGGVYNEQYEEDCAHW